MLILNFVNDIAYICDYRIYAGIQDVKKRYFTKTYHEHEMERWSDVRDSLEQK